MARLLFLGASVSQLPAIRFAKAEGHFVVACDGDPNAVAFPFCDVAAVVDFRDADAVAEVGTRERVDGVLAICTDRAVVPAALVAERLGLPGLAPEVAQAMTHKPTMRARLALAGVPQPVSRAVTATDDLTPLRSVPLPAVLKPADSGGQRGLFMIERLDQVAALLPATLAVSSSGEALFEQYVEGLEVNTLFAVRGGVPTLLTLSDRLRPSGSGFGVGWIHSYPSALPRSTQTEVEEVASRAIRALGMVDGIAFPQLIAAERGVVVVEVAARIAAGQMADLVRHATGIELYRIAIQQAIGLPVPDAWVTARRTRPVAIRFLTAAPGLLPLGVVRSISGLERVHAARGVLDAGLYFGLGTEIGPLRVDADRRGYVIATAGTAPRALARADAAVRRLHVEVEPDPAVAAGRKRSGRRRGTILAAPGLVAVLVAATAAAFLLTERAKLQPPLISGTRVDHTFSPVCRCPQDVAHIAFRLLRRTKVEVTVLNSSGRTVARLLGPRELGARLVRLVWNGRYSTTRSVAPSGNYFPNVTFPGLDRSLRLPSPIALDTAGPKVEGATVHRLGGGVAVRYRFSEPARALLLVGGRRAVLTRFATRVGVARWSGRFASGRPLAGGRHRFELIAVDLAGNRSPSRRLGRYSEH